jgi:hypothetical protein
VNPGHATASFGRSRLPVIGVNVADVSEDISEHSLA